MIKVPYNDSKDVWQWYVDYTTKCMKKKIAKKQRSINGSSSFPKGHIEAWLCSLPDDVEQLSDLLLLPTDKLRQKYPHIDRYCELSKTHNGRVLLKKINNKIKFLFNYDSIGYKVRWRIAEQMDISVCPYCNRQYIHPVKNAGYLGDLDHILCKDDYPLFALSVSNMLPCCKPCNQKFKRMSQKDILSPRADGFDDDCILRINANDTAAILGESKNFDLEWKIQENAPANKKKQIANNIELFKLNKQYRFHKDDVTNLLRLKKIYNKNYRTYIAEMLGLQDNEDINRLIYKCSLQPDKFKDEPLSKMTYDIIKYN